ncbi:MAG: dTMP kinase [Rectinemataceae bacterium]|nr:dTMP kinase [Rectinemataceae bacterium]
MDNAAEKRVLNRFVVLEGIDGAGTTTQLNRLCEALTKAGIPHWITCEPTTRPEGALIRRILGGELPAHPGTVAHLFAADRHEHLYGAGGIVEHLDAGDIVISDRYVFSSLAYQGATCGFDLPAKLNAEFPLPGLTLFFDVDPSLSMARLTSRTHLEIYEKQSFQEKVADCYEEALATFACEGSSVARIDASRAPAAVTAQVLEAVGNSLGIRLSL